MENNTKHILFTEIPGQMGDLGLITLQRQQALNALNHDMFLILHHQLKTWAKAPHIKAVVIRAESGRAFSAGGDIRHAYELGLAKNPNLPLFFRDEYRLDHFIFHFPKPYIALLDGLTMGGGAGISLHGSHRIVTDRMTFAMPETSIGFFPDIGATYFLSRLPHFIGFYLGLTGNRIDYRDCLALQLADFYVDHSHLTHLIDELANTAFSSDTKKSVSDIIKKRSISAPSSELMTHQTDIAHHFSKKLIEEILESLQSTKDDWSQMTAKQLQEKSPTSLKITFQALKMATTLSFDECIKMEYGIATHFLKSNDFYEGVRAVIIDKDKSPRWNPSTLNKVTQQEVASYFEPVAEPLFSLLSS